MGNNCCGYSVMKQPGAVSNPQELEELHTNINKCLDPEKKKSIKEQPHIEQPKDKYEAFEVSQQVNANGNGVTNNNNEGLESSNLQSVDNAAGGQAVTVGGQQTTSNPTVVNNVVTPAKGNLPEKNKSKEIGDETLPESTNLKLHIDLNQATEQPIIKPSEKPGGKSPKRNGVKKDKKPAKVINLQEIKLSDETTKKLTIMKEKSEKAMQSQAQIQSPTQNNINTMALKRSRTINANALGEINNNEESEYYEQSEKSRKIEEIKKEFIEDKKKLEKKQSEKSIARKSSRNNKNSPTKNEKDSVSPKNEEVENWKQEELKRLGSMSPKKSLLKRAKTIGEELKGDKSVKKKVKFKDLDNKGKKKRK